ncbi:MAG: multidrug efflux pump [Candidatus Sumerlaeota bacterium]|nr:multidrug efflux pump [Candidatus Sumerlaeota bacterium]
MFSRFFIDRPVLASVISILIFSVGLVALSNLPVERFPQITPPTVTVSAYYPGADAETVAQSVATPIEQELSGAEGLIYYQSYAGNDGSLRLTVYFEVGTDLDIAAVEIQNRLSRAESRLPEEVSRQGITVEKASDSMLMIASLKSTNPEHDAVFLSNYAQINMLDTIRRIPGIGSATVLGARDYAMRAWLDPDQLMAKGLTINEVAAAVRDENNVYAAGTIGGEPVSNGPDLTLPVLTPGRMRSAEEFSKIILKANPDGTVLRLSDIARLELSAKSFSTEGRQDGEATALIGTYLQPDANALDAAQGFEETMQELAKNFPEGVYYELPYDTTPFIEAGIDEVTHTFLEASLLVSLVVLIFLGTWRATLIPLLAVPVSIVGAFAGMYALGFSVNTLTLFGLVLAIGIVVDDAIIVVENVERLMHEEHLPAREATIKAMEQVSGPLIAIVLVLSAVFIPVGFLGGLTGELYRQFAVTIAVSVAISGFCALTLSPALAAVLLRREVQRKVFIFRWFDSAFGLFTRFYRGLVRQSIRFGYITILLFIGMIVLTVKIFNETPGGFIPQEDQGFLIVGVILPPGASLDRTSAVIEEVEDFLLAQPEVEHTVSLAGMDILSGFSANTAGGVLFVKLAPWDQRMGPGQSVEALVGRTGKEFAALKEAIIIPLNPPAVHGLGLRAGIEFQLQDRTGGSLNDFAQIVTEFTETANNDPGLQSVMTTFNVSSPQLFVDVDRLNAKMRGVETSDVYEALQTILGTLYVNDFEQEGRIFQVLLSADSEYRDNPSDIGRLYVRNKDGGMVQLSGIVSTEFQSGPAIVSHFNGFPAVQITGEPVEGKSTGEAIETIEKLAADTLPPGYVVEWSGASYQEIKASGEAFTVIGMGLFVVFLVLCGLYERWTLPIAVLLGVPAGAFGAIIALHLRGIPKDIYFQIGLLTLIGLAAKNAILIVEFASELRRGGMGIVDSAVEAARVRLRPFVMTSLAFILGILPLFLATGAGAAGRRSIGTGVMGGMIAATFLDMLFVPMLFVIVQWTGEKGSALFHRLQGVHTIPAKATVSPTPEGTPE